MRSPQTRLVAFAPIVTVDTTEYHGQCVTWHRDTQPAPLPIVRAYTTGLYITHIGRVATGDDLAALINLLQLAWRVHHRMRDGQSVDHYATHWRSNVTHELKPLPKDAA